MSEKKREMLPWVEKYRPKNLNEVEDLEEAKEKLLFFIKNYKKVDEKGKKACILYGPTGTGKTALVHALAESLNLELLEMNASDLRNREKIKYTIGKALSEKSLFMKNRLILVDELEGISGQEDRGGLAELSKLIDTSEYPIIMITNNPYEKKLRELRKKCEIVQIKGFEVKNIISLLKKISKKEKIEIGDDAIKMIALNAKGDVRAAINDLQTLSIQNKKLLLAEVNDFLSLAIRDKEQNIFNALKILFTSSIIHEDLFENVDMQMEEIIRWIEENIPKEYKNPEMLVRAYDMLGLAGLFMNRIIRQQYWRYLVYVNLFLCSIGPYANTVKGKKGYAGYASYTYSKYTKYSPPSFFIQLYERKKAKERELEEELSKKLHCSKRKIKNEMWLLKNFINYEIELA